MARRAMFIPPIVVALAISAGGALPVFLVGSLSIEEGHSLSLAPTHFAILIAVFFAAAAVFAAATGHMTDRIGYVVVMRVGVAGTLVGSILATVSYSKWLYFAGIAVTGMGYGASQPAVSKFLTGNVKLDRHGMAFGLRQTGVPLATLLAGLAVAATSGNGEWRMAFAFAAVFSVVNLLLLSNYRSATEVAGRVAANGGTRASVGTAEAGWPVLLQLGTSLGLGAGTIYVVASFAVPSARAVGISAIYAGFIATIGGTLALVCRVLAGVMADVLHFRPLRVAGSMLIVGSIGYLLLSIGTKYLFIIGIFVAFSVGSGWNALFLLALARDFPGNSGKATGIGLSGAYVGGVLGPLIFGFVLARFGLSTAWITEAVVACLAGAGAVSAGRILKHIAETATSQ